MANNSRIIAIKKAKFTADYFQMNTTIWRNFQICISLPLTLYQIILKDLKRNQIF